MSMEKKAAEASPGHPAKTRQATDRKDENRKPSVASVPSSDELGIEDSGSGGEQIEKVQAGMEIPRLDMKKYRIFSNRAGENVREEAEDGIGVYLDQLFDSREEAEKAAMAELELQEKGFFIVEVDPRTLYMCARTTDQIGDEINSLTDLVWYHRTYRQFAAERRAGGGPMRQDVIDALKKIEARQPKEYLSRMTNYELGMINGHLSALRWVMGSEWDDLDI